MKKVIVHGMGGVINEVWAYTAETILKLSKYWYPEGEAQKELILDLIEKGYHSAIGQEEGYSELVVMEVIE